MSENKSGIDPGYASDVEAMIQAAGEYVQPTRDLRPRIMDAVEEQNSEEHVQRNLRRMLLIAGLFLILAVPVTKRLSELPFPRSPSVEEIEQRVELRSQQPMANYNWMLVDVFVEMRRAQADPERKSLGK